MLEDLRLATVKRKKVTRLPLTIRLPDHFIKSNNIQMNDVIVMYMTGSGEIIIIKEDR